METILLIIVPALATALVAVTTWALRKTGLSPEAQVTSVEIAKSAIDFVEDLVISKTKDIKGPQKMQVALEIINNLAKEHPETVDYLKTHGEQLVERLLRSKLTGDDLTPRK